MKLLIIGILFCLFCQSARCQIRLDSGDSYIYQFSSLPRNGHASFGIAEPYGAFSLPIFPSELGPTGVLKFEMFEDSPAAVPIFSRTLTASSSILDTHETVVGLWSDAQGSIRLSMLSGSVDIRIFSLAATARSSQGGFDLYGARIVPVPEPSSIGLIGLALFMVFRRVDHS